MTTNLEKNVDVLLSFLEYKAEYNEPIIEQWENKRGAIARAFYDSLRPWGVGLDNLSGKQNPSSIADLEFSINVPRHGCRFSVRVGSLAFEAKDPDRGSIESLLELLTAGLTTIQASCNVTVQSAICSIAAHVKPIHDSIRNVTAPFVNLRASLSMGDVRTYGFGAYGEDGYVVVDSSSLARDALFFKISTTFPGNLALDEIAKSVLAREEELLSALGLRLE